MGPRSPSSTKMRRPPQQVEQAAERLRRFFLTAGAFAANFGIVVGLGVCGIRSVNGAERVVDDLICRLLIHAETSLLFCCCFRLGFGRHPLLDAGRRGDESAMAAITCQ